MYQHACLWPARSAASGPATVAVTPPCPARCWRAGGYWGIDEGQCVARGCCFGAAGAFDYKGHQPPPTFQHSCFYAAPSVPIKKVHVAQANHFDAGYHDSELLLLPPPLSRLPPVTSAPSQSATPAHSAIAIQTRVFNSAVGTCMLCAPAVVGVELNEYFDTYIPLAINVSRQLRAAGGPEGVRWMCQSWILNLYLDCPSGAGLHCPDAVALGEFDEAVRNGAITWHGKYKRKRTHASARIYAYIYMHMRRLLLGRRRLHHRVRVWVCAQRSRTMRSSRRSTQRRSSLGPT